MADNRGMQFPGHQQVSGVPGYTMAPNMRPQFMAAGVQPGSYPMMQQQQPMMVPPGVVPQMYPMQMGMRAPAPPPYTAQMAHNYRQQRPAAASSRPRKELSEKERQFQLTQQKLKQFGRPGIITADADRLIANMFGGQKPQPKPNKATPRPQEDDDGFGDFMQGPSVTSHSLPPSEHPSASGQPDPARTGDTTLSGPTQTGQDVTSLVQQATVPQMEKKIKEEKKGPDLAAMMMECSDLNAPQKARLFIKPSLKEVQVEHHTQLPTFHQSDQSRTWTGFDQLEGLFATEPPPAPIVVKATKRRHSSGAGKTVVAKTSAGLPVWCEAPDDQLPPLYHHVAEATIVEGNIETERVYPILLLSGLQKDTLGAIWQMANKDTPGQLKKSELYAILAMIALTQNNYTVSSVDILLRCPLPPVPFLGSQSVAMPTQPAANQGPPLAAGQPMGNDVAGSQPAGEHIPQNIPCPGYPVAQGPIVPPGQVMPPGIQGPPGQTGPMMPPGQVGPMMPPGIQGPPGQTGPMMPPGQTGPMMPPGQIASMVPPGPMMPPGQAGPMMPPGQAGPMMPPGQAGPMMPPGQAGPMMPPGQAGPMVPPGPMMPPGQAGPMMPPGQAGPMVPPGPMMPPGQAGPMMPPGQVGPMVPPGPMMPPGQVGPLHDPSLQTLPATALPAEDDFADFQTAPTVIPETKQQNDEGFGDFIGGSRVAASVEPPVIEEKPKYLISAPVIDHEMDVVSADDKYNSNVRSFFCSSDSSTAEPSNHESEQKGHSTPSLDDEDYTDCRDSSQVSTSEQSENEDIRAFETYVEEFHRKKELREQQSPKHKPLSKSSHVVKPQPKIAEPVVVIPIIPPVLHGLKPKSSDDFADFKSAQGGGSLFKPVPSKNVFTDQAAKAKQTVLQAVQKLSQETDDFADFQEAPKDDGLPSVPSESNLLGEEDKYSALRAFTGDEVTKASIFVEPEEEQEQEEFANFDEQGEDWSGFTEAPPEQTGKGLCLPRDVSSASLGNVSTMSQYGSERGEERAEDWADFAGVEEPDEAAAVQTDDWGAFSTTSNSNETAHTVNTEVASSSEFVAEPSSRTRVSFGIGSDNISNVDRDDWGDFSQTDNSKKEGFPEAPAAARDWAGFQSSQDSNILTVKKTNLQANEVLEVFKVKGEGAASSSHNKLPHSSSAKSSVRIPSMESDIDDDRVPPPMDVAEEEEDHNMFSRGYDLDDMVRHTAVTTACSTYFGTSTHRYATSKNKTTTTTTTTTAADTLRNSEDRTHSASPDIHIKELTPDSGSSKFMDSYGWKDRTLNVRTEDSQSVSSLEFPKGEITLKDSSENGGTDSQSVSSAEFGNGEASWKTAASAESKSVDSLDLYKKEEQEVEEDSAQPADSTPQPVLAQTLLAGGEMRAMADRYNIGGEVIHSNNHEYQWKRCIDNCCRMIKDANNLFNSVSTSSVCNEIMKSSQGSEYVAGIIEIYRVACRIMAAMTAAGIKTPTLDFLLKDVDIAWNNLTAFFVGASVLPEPATLDFVHAVLKSDSESAQQQACGVCLLDVDIKPKSFSADDEPSKLTYAGRQYHSPCANFWINCVDCTLPALKLPELL